MMGNTFGRLFRVTTSGESYSGCFRKKPGIPKELYGGLLTMLEVIRQDYIRTARAKGQVESVVLFKHALLNAMIPILTIVGIQFAGGLGGAVVNEQVFAIPGVGKLMVDAIKARNYPLIQGSVLILALLQSTVNLVVDILYAFVDPRIRSQYSRKKKNKSAKPAAAIPDGQAPAQT